MLDLIDPTMDEAGEVPALPLPEVVDTPAVVLAGLLAGGTRPLVLDAASVREIHDTAAAMLLALLRAKRDAGVDARLAGASPALRRRWAGHPLAAFITGEPPRSAHHDAEALFICPDRDELGFSPSLR
ncbi:MAG TPA: STAS domain-containing protein [Longimicrobium sp.]|nr:STAS domain-containing protein [Longimicrobium sp.]